MKNTGFREKAEHLRKLAVCAFALTFLLSACGAGRAKSESAASGGAYYADNAAQEAGGFYREESAAEEAWEEPEEMELDMDAVAPMAASASYDSGSSVSGPDSSDVEQADLKSSNRKIVYSGNVTLQTLEYDRSAQSIHDKITQCGGFIESEDTFNEDPYWYYSSRTGAAANRTRRRLTITARIPAEKFETFMKDLENDGQVTNTSVNARNISVSYATHDASRKALEIEKDRLLKMMDKAETVEEMIAVEERLTEVERELGDEMTQLSAMDRDLDFSTVNISLQEVFEYSDTVIEVTYGERLRRAFGRAVENFIAFWQDALVFIVENFPFLILLIVVLLLIVRFYRRNHEKWAKRSMEKRMEKLARIGEVRRRNMQRAQGTPVDPPASGAPAAGAPAEAADGTNALEGTAPEPEKGGTEAAKE